MGMVIAPVAATLPADVPLIIPKKPLATTLTLAVPPRALPLIRSARLIMNSEAPDIDSKVPNMMKKYMKVADDPTGMPNTPFVVYR